MPDKSPQDAALERLEKILLDNLTTNAEVPQAFDEDQFAKSKRYCEVQKEKPAVTKPPKLDKSGGIAKDQ